MLIPLSPNNVNVSTQKVSYLTSTNQATYSNGYFMQIPEYIFTLRPLTKKNELIRFCKYLASPFRNYMHFKMNVQSRLGVSASFCLKCYLNHQIFKKHGKHMYNFVFTLELKRKNTKYIRISRTQFLSPIWNWLDIKSNSLSK